MPDVDALFVLSRRPNSCERSISGGWRHCCSLPRPALPATRQACPWPLRPHCFVAAVPAAGPTQASPRRPRRSRRSVAMSAVIGSVTADGPP